MSWEEDELKVYEERRARILEKERVALSRARLLSTQSPMQWNSLRKSIIDRCDSLNAKAGRAVLRSVDPQTDHLEIRREDEARIGGRYDSVSRKVRFVSDNFIFNEREYELIIKTVGDEDGTAWFCVQTEITEPVDAIALALLTSLLRAEKPESSGDAS